jgi:hypothetical protein
MDKIEFETFREIGSFEQSNITQKEPSSFNGWVRVVKYKVTFEEIEEPIEVYRERLQKLWDECDNMRHWDPIKATAKKYGIELTGNAGSKRKR